MKKTRCVFFLILIFLPPLSLFAFDFGIITNQYVGFGNHGGGENQFKYQADILPRFSFLIGDTGEFFLSAGMTLGVENEFYYVPELLRTEFSMRFDSIGIIKAGRIPYADPLSFIANGLFDGAKFSHNNAAGNFSIGAWYTGLLYKKTANITMTQKDQELYDSVLDYGNFFDTYFAPPRLLISLDWEHPSIGELVSLKVAVTGQFELSDGDEKFHSQYLTLKASFPVKSFLFELGGSMQASQSDAFAIAFAWNVGVFWTLPTSFSSRLSFTGNFAGGRTDDVVRAFVPITTKFYGNILKAKLSGLTVLDLNYTARISREFGTSISALYFIRNDLGTYKDYPVSSSGSNGYFLGAELFALLIWSPFSDLQLNLGGGAFLPSLGDVSDEKTRWRIELTAVVGLY